MLAVVIPFKKGKLKILPIMPLISFPKAMLNPQPDQLHKP